MVSCWSHCCHASFETFSQMRLPSAPGYGGKSRPSASRPSFTHFTVLSMAELYSLEKYFRAAPPVIELPAARGQRVDSRGAKALLEEPVRRPRGEREHAPDMQRLRPLLASLQQL